jgi:hypothetical protein
MPAGYPGTGAGLGNFDLMGNAWGIDGTQYNPPPLSAWSKMVMGWLKPMEISQPGFYRIDAAHLGNVCTD